MEQKRVATALFGAKLKQLREQKGITQAGLAAKLEVTQQTVASWECGRTEPSITSILAMSDILDVSVQTMFAIGDKASTEIKDPGFDLIQRNASKMSDSQFKKMLELLKLSFDEFEWEAKPSEGKKKHG